MQAFDWRKPRTLDEAVEHLRSRPDPKLIAGGMTLIPTLKLNLSAPSDLIDLSGVPDLAQLSIAQDRLEIGAMTRHADVASSPLVRERLPALAVLAGGIGDPCVRRRGTIGGSVANSDPAADYPAGLLGLDAQIVTSERTIEADSFFLGLFETALKPDEIITSVRFKIPDRAHYLKFRHPVSGYAMAGVMVARYGSHVRVAITGAGACAFRATEMEDALDASFAPGALQKIALDPAELMGDMHCSAEYRAHVVGVLSRRAVAALQ